MSSTLVDDLQSQIAGGSVVAIVGAGVSVGATNGNPLAGWTGLLHHGVQRCLELPTTRVTQVVAEGLRYQIDSGDLDLMLAAAEVVSGKLGAPKGGEWGRWLRESVGSLRAQQREVLEALRDLGVTLATTNYDSLIEETTLLPPVTWQDGASVERVLRGDEKGVLHLHGHWQKPESVILGIRDYDRVLGDAHAQTILRAMRSVTTLLFVGCGEGLHDPNFANLLRWSAKMFVGSEYRHFRLARESEVDSLQAQHPAEQRIFVVGYGPDHQALAAFLRRLRPKAVSRSSVSAASTTGHPAGLPPAPLCFGRDQEIEDLVATLLAAKPAPVPVLGPPGIGKSAITLVALNDPRVAARYGPRRYFVRCDTARTREALAVGVATALGLPPGPQIEPALFAALASAPAALVLDNTETPWEADTLRVEELLAQLTALPGVALIASLRGASRPLGVPWRQPVQPTSLPLADARKAFLAVAGEGFSGDPDLDRLLAALDGVPLAINLMAGAAQGQPGLAGTWTRWQSERTRMLRRAGADDPLLNIEVSYETSIQGQRMTAAAQRLLSLLGWLPGGLAHLDVDAVFPGGAGAAAVLRQAGLAFDEARRLRLLAPLREYLRLARPPRPVDLPPALAHYLGLAVAHGDRAGAGEGAEAIARLTPEAANIEAAILVALDGPETQRAVEAAIAFGEFARFSGLGTTAPLKTAAAAAHRQETHHLAANCIKSLGDIALARSDHDGARQRYDEALPLYRRIPEPYSIGITHCHLARIAANDAQRRWHVAEARAAWQSIKRADLLAELEHEFGGE